MVDAVARGDKIKNRGICAGRAVELKDGGLTESDVESVPVDDGGAG